MAFGGGSRGIGKSLLAKDRVLKILAREVVRARGRFREAQPHAVRVLVGEDVDKLSRVSRNANGRTGSPPCFESGDLARTRTRALHIRTQTHIYTYEEHEVEEAEKVLGALRDTAHFEFLDCTCKTSEQTFKL